MPLPGFYKKVPDPAKTFSSFIEGESNRFARAAALAFGESGCKASLLYIYGDRGTGKSHLINALAVYAEGKGLKTVLGGMDGDKDTRRLPVTSPQIILIDDYPFNLILPLPRPGIVEYLESGGKAVLTGSVSPEAMPESALSSFLREQGRSADIQPPEEELRIAILKSRADEEGVFLPDDAARFIAGHIEGNVRSLLGGFERVKALSFLAGRQISRFSAIQALKDYLWDSEV